MKIILTRDQPRDGVVLGALWHGGVLQCYTRERVSGVVPNGNWPVDIRYDPMLNRWAPVIDTQTGSHRIHYQEIAQDGIAVSAGPGVNLWGCRQVWSALLDALHGAKMSGDRIEITVQAAACVA